MSNNITKIPDYKGYTMITELTNENDSFFEEFAEQIERNILTGIDSNDYGLLGDQVYLALIADLDNNEPQTAPYINLINGTTYTQTDGQTVNFIGIKEMLTYFVYSEYIKNNKISQYANIGINPASRNQQEQDIKYINYNAHLRWNKGVDYFNGQVYDYLLFYQSSFTNWEFTKQSKYLTRGLI